jgi:Polysaccharide lyase
MHRALLAALLVLLAFALVGDSAALHSATGWAGDLQTGTFGQWQGVQDTQSVGTAAVGDHTTATVIQPAGAPLRYVGDFHVFADNSGQPKNKGRAEVVASVASTSAVAGQAWWYDWFEEFPSKGNTCQPAWQVVTQFDTNGQWDSPAIAIATVNGVRWLQETVYSGTRNAPGITSSHVNLVPLQFDHWYHFQLFVRWSHSQSGGQVQLVLDGRTVIPLHQEQTMPSDFTGQYLKQGMYQSMIGQCAGESYVTGTTRHS